MKLENLIIKLNTSYDIEDIDEVEANGTSKANTIMKLQNVNFILTKFQNYTLTQKSMKLNMLLQKKLKKNSLKT